MDEVLAVKVDTNNIQFTVPAAFYAFADLN